MEIGEDLLRKDVLQSDQGYSNKVDRKMFIDQGTLL